MATFTWRSGGFGAFNQPLSWSNTTVPSDQSNAPGPNDTAILEGPGQIVSGPAGTVDQLIVRALPGMKAWELAGTPLTITAHQLTTTTGLSLTFGATITLTGQPQTNALPTAATLNGPTIVNASQLLADAGTIAIGTSNTNAASLTSNAGRVTTLGMTVGSGATGDLSLLGGSLAITPNPALQPPNTPSGILTIGTNAGNGSLYMANGAALTAAAIILATDTASTALAQIGTASTITTGTLTLNAGTTTISDANTTLTSQGRIAVGGLAAATLTIAANAAVTTGTDIVVNGAGTARSTLTINAGTLRSTNTAATTALRIGDTAPATVQITGRSAVIDLGNGATQLGTAGAGTIQIQAGAQLLTTAISLAATATGTATLSIDGLGSTLGLPLGALTTGQGTASITATNQSTIAANTVSLAENTGTASLTLGSAATLTVFGTLGTGSRTTLALDGVGTALTTGGTRLLGTTTLTAGARLTTRTADSRSQPALSLARSGTATLSLSASTLDAQGYVYVARSGSGTLILDQASTLTAGSAATNDGLGANAPFGLTIGDGTPVTDTLGNPVIPEFGGTGIARILNASTLRSRAGIVVGQRGTNGSLLIDGASLVAADRLIQIGAGADRAGATGTVTVQGNSTLRSAGPHLAGTSSIQIGVDTNTTGQLIVNASTLDAGGDRIAVGLRGTATLTIQAGATATAGGALPEPGLTIASSAGSSGVVTVTGPNSRLTVAASTVVGGNEITAGGSANLIATQGGVVTTTALTIWSQADVRTDGAAQINIGTTTTQAAGINIASNGTLTLRGGQIDGPVAIAGTLISYGGLVTGTVTATGQLRLASGTTDIAAFAGHATFTAPGETLRIRTLTGPTQIDGLIAGDSIELAQPATLSGNRLTVGAYTITLTARSGDTLKLDAIPTGTRLTLTDPLFDTAYYLSHNPDVKAAGIDPYLHYISNGYKEGRDPSALFSTSYYLKTNPDVAAAGLNPLLHFETTGWIEGRNPDPVFDIRYYQAQNRDVAALGLNPLLHYVQSGAREGRNPSAQFSLANYRAAYPDTLPTADPLAQYLDTGISAGRTPLAVGPPPEPGFDATYYYAANPDVRAAGVDAGRHYATTGFKEGRNPDAYFDSNYYLTQNPDVRAAGIDPLAHYIASGAAEGRNPSLLFSSASYLNANPDVRAARLNPLLHFLASGRSEGRAAPLAGPAAPPDPLIKASFYDPQLGATLIPTGPGADAQSAGDYLATGWLRGLNPDAFFNTAYYLARNPDVARAGLNPLTHYETNGWKEGRDPSAQFSTNKYLTAYSDVRAAAINPLLHYITNGQAEGRIAFTV